MGYRGWAVSGQRSAACRCHALPIDRMSGEHATLTCSLRVIRHTGSHDLTRSRPTWSTEYDQATSTELCDDRHIRYGHGLDPSMGWVGLHFPAHVMGWVE